MALGKADQCPGANRHRPEFFLPGKRRWIVQEIQLAQGALRILNQAPEPFVV